MAALRPNPVIEDHRLLAGRDCFFNKFAATLRVWRSPPPFATQGRAMSRPRGPTWL